MPVRITYYVHGTTEDNENGIASGWSDVDLSELGVRQVEELREGVKDREFDAVFSSDLKRAVRTAEMVWGARVVRDARLRECDWGGESYETVKGRMRAFLDDLKKNYDGRHVAIVAHKAPQLALDVLLRGMSWEEALAGDWRKTKDWRPGWEYVLE
jgi:broad specificity phosphatase PhoE